MTLSAVETRSPELGVPIQNVVDLGIEFYLASNPLVRPHLNMSPYGQPLSWLDFTQTTQQGWSTPAFLDLFNVMNSIAFGARGIPMPRWVMIDLALMPSAALVATLSQEAFAAMLRTVILDEVMKNRMTAVLEAAQQSRYTGPIPVGGYCAAPSAAPGRWVGWSLWSVIPKVGLAVAAKALALAAYRTKWLDGITQYDNTALKVHTRFGFLRVITATVPLHNSPGSFIYENDLTLPIGANVPSASFLLDPADFDRQRVLQATIEAGQDDLFILPPGRVERDGKILVPILQTPRAQPIPDPRFLPTHETAY